MYASACRRIALYRQFSLCKPKGFCRTHHPLDANPSSSLGKKLYIHNPHNTYTPCQTRRGKFGKYGLLKVAAAGVGTGFMGEWQK